MNDQEYSKEPEARPTSKQKTRDKNWQASLCYASTLKFANSLPIDTLLNFAENTRLSKCNHSPHCTLSSKDFLKENIIGRHSKDKYEHVQDIVSSKRPIQQ